MSKGSTPRPYSVDRKTFDKNWERIFGNKKTSGKRPAKDVEKKQES